MANSKTHIVAVTFAGSLLMFSLCIPFAAGQIEPTVLEVGKPIERELKAGETHRFNITLSAGQFLSIVADQRRIDVVLTLIGPDGNKLVEVNSPNQTHAPESIAFVTESPGEYRLEVRSANKNALAGRYGLEIDELRAGTDDDKVLIEGQRAKAEANLLMADSNEESTTKAFEKYEEAARLFRLLKDKKREALLIHQLGGIYDDSLNKPAKAIEYFTEALAFYENLDQKQNSVNVLIDIGIAYENLLAYDDAVNAYQKAITIALEINDKSLQAKTYNQLGRGHARLGDFNQSLADFKQALKLSEGFAWTDQTSVTLMGLGNIYNALGNSARALEYEQNNVSLLEENGAMRDIPPQLLNIGNIYLGQENCEQALEYYQRALAGFETNRAQVGTSYALSNIGNAYGCLGQYSEALSYIERSRLLKTKFLPKDPGTLSDIGRIYRLQGKYREALDYYQKSLDLFQELKDFSFFAAGVMEAMAEIYYLQGNYSKSLEFADKATALAKQLDYPYAWNSLTTAGYAHRALSQTKEARKDLESAIGKIESLSTQTLGGQSQQEHYLEGMTGPYQMLVDISVSEDKILEAFGYAERFKARTLLDILQTGKIDITKAMSAQEREQERKFKLGIVSLNTRISREKEKISLDELNQQLQKKRLEFEDFQTRINISHPELKVQRGEMKPIGLDEAGGLLSDAKSAFLEFVVANNKAFTFVITKNALDKTTLKVYPIEVNQKDLTARVEKYRATLAAGDLDFQKQSRELYDLLLKPARAELSGKTNLIIVPDGPLWNLPFQALQNEKNRYLVEQAAVSYAPSLTALKEMAKKAKARKPDAGMELVAFGNPIVGKATSDRIKQVFMSEKLEPLPESERLVNEMGKMYGASRSKVYTGDAAREETAKTEAPKYRIVQFATHGILNNVSPMYSHLVLAQNDKNPNEDGLLEAWEMKDLDLKADMVILSACDTARGRISSGEGMIGMSWALFIAGTPTTIASQWKVESSSTTELMLEFHRQLLTGKVTKAEALRRASLKLLHSPKYQHPSYWGAWVLVGDGN